MLKVLPDIGENRLNMLFLVQYKIDTLQMKREKREKKTNKH